MYYYCSTHGEGAYVTVKEDKKETLVYCGYGVLLLTAEKLVNLTRKLKGNGITRHL